MEKLLIALRDEWLSTEPIKDAATKSRRTWNGFQVTERIRVLLPAPETHWVIERDGEHYDRIPYAQTQAVVDAIKSALAA